MGNPDNITIQKIINAAKAGGTRNIKETMANMVKTYHKKIKGTPADTKPVA